MLGHEAERIEAGRPVAVVGRGPIVEGLLVEGTPSFSGSSPPSWGAGNPWTRGACKAPVQ